MACKKQMVKTMQNDQGSNGPMKRCELITVEMTKDRVDHKPLSETLH